MSKPRFDLNEPLKLGEHPRPRTRRELLKQGFATGAAALIGLNCLRPAAAFGLDTPQSVIDACNIRFDGAGKIPFICFDLAGGANIAGSNVLVGGRGGQLDFLDAAGYAKQGLPASFSPRLALNINTELGLAFHSDSGFLRGILERTAAGTRAMTNGCVIAARSENDTANNPHNPMYGIHMAGARGSLLSLCGSRPSDSGGNSMAPAALFDATARPTKIDRPGDVTGLVDVGDLVGLLDESEVVAVMESMYRLSRAKLGRAPLDSALADQLACTYLESAGLAERYSNPASLDPRLDPDISGPGGIFSEAELNDSEFAKTAAVMKMVVEGYAGAGTVTMGGYDYHTGDRATGELRDLRAGRCMGACLEYAARKGKPLMLYVFTDGSVFSNGMLDNSENGRGKGVWTGDSQQTSAAFFMVLSPAGRPQLYTGAGAGDRPEWHQQLGYMRPSGDVETASSPAANNVNQLAHTVVLNYLALHGEQGSFANLYAQRGINHGLGTDAALDRMVAFAPIA